LQKYRPDAAAANAAQDFDIVIINDAANFQGKYTPDNSDLNYEGDLDGQMALGISWPTPLTVCNTGGYVMQLSCGFLHAWH
jgi:tripeptidyl-peptidase-1